MGANLDGIAGDEVVVEGARGFGQAQRNLIKVARHFSEKPFDCHKTCHYIMIVIWFFRRWSRKS